MFNRKVIKDSDVAVYTMPTLEEETPETRELMLRNIKDYQQEAYEEGFSTGEKAGFQEGEKKAVILVDRLTQIIEEVEAFKTKLAKQVENHIVDLSINIARKVIIEEVNTRPEIIVSIVKEALKKIQRLGLITIKINPALYDIFMKRKPEITDIHEDIIFDVSPNIPLTGPLVTSQIEEVVTDIESITSNVIEEIRETSVNSAT